MTSKADRADAAIKEAKEAVERALAMTESDSRKVHLRAAGAHIWFASTDYPLSVETAGRSGGGSESRSSTAVETADERCGACGKPDNDPDVPFPTHDPGHPFKPVEEPVSPPSPDTCETCGEPENKIVHTPPSFGEGYAPWHRFKPAPPPSPDDENHCSRCGEALIGRPRMCAIHGETGVRPRGGSVSPPLQEGGGWTRSWEHNEDGEPMAQWRSPRGTAYQVPRAVEEAIRAEATAEWQDERAGMARSNRLLVEEREAENRRLQTALDEAQKDRDKYRTALEAAEERATQAEGQREALETALREIYERGVRTVSHNSIDQERAYNAETYWIAGRALSPSTEAPSEEN